jgi:DNA-binding transcriptional ArsR family regulator
MPKNKKWTLPPEALQLVAERFKILGEPIRLRILQSLETGELSVNEITGAVESTQPNVSKHLKILQDAGLVARRQEGNSVFYSIADESIFQLCELVCASLKERYASRSAIFG